MLMAASAASGASAGGSNSNSAHVKLTRKERDLLNVLMHNPGRCISREMLLQRVWGYGDGVKSRTVDVHIQRLRRKMGAEADAIKTIVRAGYCWMPPDFSA